MGHNQSKLTNKNIKNIEKKTNEKSNKLIKTSKSNNSNFNYTKDKASLSEAQKRRLQSELEDSMYYSD